MEANHSMSQRAGSTSNRNRVTRYHAVRTLQIYGEVRSVLKAYRIVGLPELVHNITRQYVATSFMANVFDVIVLIIHNSALVKFSHLPRSAFRILISASFASGRA